MLIYNYKAVNAGGKIVIGTLQGESEHDVVGQLQRQSLIPVRVTPGALTPPLSKRDDAHTPSPTLNLPFIGTRKVSRDQITAVTRELSTLLHAGLTLDRSLETLIRVADSPVLIELLQGIRDDVRGGQSLSLALEARPLYFSRFYTNLIRAGEAGGALSTVLSRLADTMERAKELKESVKSAMIYPCILLSVAIVSIAVILIWVVPQFEATFAKTGNALPWLTEVVITLGNGVKSGWWLILLLIFLLLMGIRRALNNASYRAAWDAWILNRAKIGEVIKNTETARLTRTLATLLKNGVPLLLALTIAKETVTNLKMARVLDGVVTELREGRGFGRPLANTNTYPKLATQMIAVGEESGQLTMMLEEVADIYDREVKVALKRFIAFLEPIIIITLAGIIFVIVLAIMLGVIGMTDIVG
ncbi:MAG: type II secretion system F family protein [Burkholderiales bacterium]|jgi:general secretion pathway protein F|nr:type II secretion system F family protein [Burkholderiales bacterium]